MRRKSLILLALVPLLLVLLMTQLAHVQAARTLQAVEQPRPDAGDPTPEPLNSPLSIRIRQQIPLTIALDLLAPLTSTDSFVGPGDIVITVPPTLSELLTATAPLTLSLPATQTLAPTTDAVADAVATPELVVSLAPTSDITVTTVPIELPDAASAISTAITSTLSVTESDVLTSTPDLFAGIPITLDLDIQVVVTDTLTSTVPATLVLKITGIPTLTVPVTINVGRAAPAIVNVLPVELVTTTVSLTGTEELTTGEGLTISEVITVSPNVTVSVEPTESIDVNELSGVTVTLPVTANVRSGPGIDFDPARTAPAGTVVEIVARDALAEWLLLREGNWIATVVIGQAPANLPVADADFVAALRDAAETATPTPVPPTQVPTATPVVAPFVPFTVTTTTNANLRAGPGTDFDVVGNTVFAQVLTIIGRNEAGDWLRLDNGNWISASLVSGVPTGITIPVSDPNQPPVIPQAAPVVTPSAGITPSVTATSTTITPISTPVVTSTVTGTIPSALPTATPRQAALSVDENVYLVEFDNTSGVYERALTAIDRLVDSASGNTAVFSDTQWVTDMNTAIQLLRTAGAAVDRVTVPDRFAAAHNSLVAASTQYERAADALAAGVSTSDVDQFAAAFNAITLGDASLAQSAAALSAYRP